jgi:cytochrome c
MAIAVAIFLFIPLIFLTNVNLMMFPEKWGTVKGFLSALMLPNVFPRYFEFLGACVAITGIFIVWYNGRKSYPIEEIYTNFTRNSIKKIGYSIATVGLSLQILFGIIVLFTLPSKGISYAVIAVMAGAGLLLAYALWYSYKTVVSEEQFIDLHFKKITIAVLSFLFFYGGSRQMYRHNSLEKHQELVAAHTAEFQKLSKEAREQSLVLQQQEATTPKTDADLGKDIFNQYCAACHKTDVKLVGPPVSEMATIYKSSKADLQKWIKAPGKKRADAPQMPGFPQLSQSELEQLSEYILTIN